MSAIPEQDIDDSLERLIGIAERALGPEYSNLRFFDTPSSTRFCLLADWAPEGLNIKPRTRIIKIDRQRFTSENAARVMSRGYTTRNDAEKLYALPNPELHHIVQPLGYKDLRPLGWDGSLSIESYFPSRTLEEHGKQQDDRSSKKAVADIRRIFSQVLEAEHYLIRKNGILHRDVKPSNILVNDNLEARMTDLANGGAKDDSRPSCDPTYGGRVTADPRLMILPSGEETAYDEQSEIHSLGKTLLYALTGNYAVEYDKKARTAARLDTGASLLDENGELSTEKHDDAISDACRQLRGDARKYAKIIKLATTLDRARQYETIDELIEDFEAVDRPGFLARVRNAWRPIVATAGIAALAIGAVAVPAAIKWRGYVEQQANVSVVHSSANGSTMETTNDYVEMSVRAYNYKENDKDNVYPDNRPYLRAEPGDGIDVNVSLKHRSHPGVKEWNGYVGRVYFEGYTGVSFSVGAKPFDDTYVSWRGGDFGGYNCFTVTKDIAPGVHDLIVEIYAPNMADTEWDHIPPYGMNEEAEKRMKRVEFPAPFSVIAQKRIHCIVGNEQWPLAASQFWRGDVTRGTLSFRNPRGRPLIEKEEEYRCPREGMSYEITMPEFGYHEIQTPDMSAVNMNSIYLGNIPDGDKTLGRAMLLEVVARNHGNETVRTYIPMHWNESPYNHHWEIGTPRADFGLRAAMFNAKQHGWPQPKAGLVRR